MQRVVRPGFLVNSSKNNTPGLTSSVFKVYSDRDAADAAIIGMVFSANDMQNAPMLQRETSIKKCVSSFPSRYAHKNKQNIENNNQVKPNHATQIF
jgi:hypothetical protein